MNDNNVELPEEFVVQLTDLLAKLPYEDVFETILYLGKVVYDHQQSQEPQIFTGE